MPSDKELWLIEEPIIDEPSDLLAMPEIKQHAVRDPQDDELGLRLLLERPEALSRSLWRDDPEHPRRTSPKNTKRRVEVLRAA
jgi:hypothetical protein